MMIRARIGLNSLLTKQVKIQRLQKMPLSSTTSRFNQTEDIEKVKMLIEQKMAELKKAEEKRIIDEKVSYCFA